LAIARAFLHNPQILLLDEPAFGMDFRNESEVLDSLSRLMRGRTCLVIASRISTVMQCNNIAVIEAGRVVEYGPHEKLLQNNAKYAELFRQQQVLQVDRVNVEVPEAALLDLREALELVERELARSPKEKLLIDLQKSLRSASLAVRTERQRLAELERKFQIAKQNGIVIDPPSPPIPPSLVAASRAVMAAQRVSKLLKARNALGTSV